MTTNFITPPDFVEDKNHTILLIDVDPVDVETLAYLCAGHDESFNVYLYKQDLNNLEWLSDAAHIADTILINTEANSLSTIKDGYVDLLKSYHYGSKHFLNNPRHISGILEYFVNRSNDRKQHSTHPL
jgi:hypothetical protein